MSAAPGVADAAVEVASAHVRSQQRLGATGRSRLRARLRGARLVPPGLAPDAVLIVRRVAMTLPATALAPWGAGPQQRSWETDARGRLAAVMDAAARPADGPVPADAEAVLFSDRAQLLACLAGDLVRGAATSRWWWRTWLGSGRSRGLAHVLGDEVQLLPTVLDTLHGWGAAVEVVAAIAPPDAVRLLRSLAATFDLPGPSPATGSGGARPPPHEGAIRAAAASSDTAPWTAVLGPGAVPADLAPEQAALLAVGLLLVRSPRHVRTAPMRDVLVRPERAWDAAATRSTVARGQGRASSAHGDAPAAAPEAGAPRGDEGSPADVDEPDPAQPPIAGNDDGEPRVARPRGHAVSSADAVRTPVERPGFGRSPEHDDAAPPRRTIEQDAAAPAVAGGRAPVDPAEPAEPVGGDATDGLGDVRDLSPPSRAAQPAPDGVATQLAGVCYLVNVVTALDLPDAVDPAWQLDRLTGWALVELLARALLDDAAADDDGLRDDPLWSLLAELDGRDPAQPVGSDLAPPYPPFRLPEPWAADARGYGGPTAADGAVVAAADPDVGDAGGSGAGPGAGGRGVQPGRAPQPGPLTSHVTPATAAWLLRARPYLRWRLAAALGDTDPVDVLRVPGRLHLTRTHLDVVVPLPAVSLPARIAGLDRDPGWVPRLGRVVTFRFVEEPAPRSAGRSPARDGAPESGEEPAP